MKLFVYYLVAALLVLGTNGQITWTCPTNSQPVTLARSYTVTVPTNITNAIPILFREGSTPHPALVSLQTPTSIKLTADSNISVTFLTQTSNFRNQLGYFIFNEGTQNYDDPPGLQLIWPDVTRSGINVTPKGCMFNGLTTRIGPFPAGTRVGFFMRQDGYQDASTYKMNNTIWWSINSTNLVNLDGFRHTSIVSIDGRIIIGFEDFTGMGDQDYNDVLFYATVEGGWDGSNIPVYNGDVVDTCLTGKVIKTRNYNCRSYGLLGTSNFQGCLGYISIPSGWNIADKTADTDLVVTNTKNFNWDRYTGQNICMTTSNGQGLYQNGTACTTMPIKYLSTNPRCVYVPCDRGVLLLGPNVTNCQQTLSQCNVTRNNVIIGQSPATKANSSIVYPNTYSVLVSTVVNSKLPLNYDVWVPTKPNVDVFVAIDLNFLSSSTLDDIRNQLPAFYNQISGLWNVKFGFGTFWSNTTSGTLGVNPHLFLTNNLATISSVANSFTTPANLVPSQNSRVVEAYRSFAGNSTIGWRRTACFGVVVVLTGRPMYNYTGRLMADMAGWNNVPVFFSNVNASTYNVYQNFINNLPIGYGGLLNDGYTNWRTMANEVLNNYTVRLQFDPYYTSTPSWNELYWVRSDMPPVVYNPPLGTWTTRTAPLTYPGSYPVNDFGIIEIFTVNMIAWGYRSFGVAVNLNNPPRVLNLTYSFNEDDSLDFDLYGKVSDPENNAVTVQILSLPGSNGALTSQGTLVPVGSIWDQNSLQFNIKSMPANWNGQMTMTYIANDGCVNSTVGTITFIVLPVNDPPTNEDFSATTTEDTNVLIDFSQHLFDIDDDPSTLKVFIQSLPTSGTLKDGATTVTSGSTVGRTLTYVPAANFNGVVTFTYRAVDPSNAKAVSASTVTVTVTPVPDPPTSTNVEFTTRMNVPVYFQLGGTSLDGNPVSAIVLSTPAKGSLSNKGSAISSTPLNVGLTSAQNLSWVPPVNQNGIPFTTFTFRVNDGLDSVSTYTVTLNVVADGALINLPPTAADLSLITPEDTDLLVNVTSLLSDGEDPISNLTVTVETLPSFGTLWNGSTKLAVGNTLPAKTVTYRPNSNYNGPDSFIYRVSDVQFYDLGKISITVTPVNDPPTSVDMTFTTYEDTSITLDGFVVNDIDSTINALSMIITKNVDKGALLNLDGNVALDVASTLGPVYTDWAILYTPPAGLNSGDDTTVFTTFKFRVSDGSLQSVNEYTVKIIVIPVNDPPAGEDIILETLEDTPIEVTFNPRDVDNAPSTLVITITSVQKGSFFLESTRNTSITTGSVIPFNGRSMWFFPDADASSTTEPLGVFRYQVSDPAGGLSPEYSGVIWVTPVNDPPVYKGILDFTTYEDTPIEMNFGVEVVDIDSEGPFTLTITRSVAVGSLWECTTSDKQCSKVVITSTPYTLVNKDLLVSFIALPDEFGLRYANFTFTVTDEQGGLSIPYFVNINVLGVNDPPIIVPTFNVLPGRVDLDEDTTVILEWTVTDIDSPLDTIVSSISVPIPASPGADLFVCPDVADGVCAQPYGDKLITPMVIPSLSPASYRVVFIPKPDQWDERNYASLTFTAHDDQGAEARPVKAIIRVWPINDPPFIQANDTVTITAPSEGALPAFTFREFNLGDPDSRNKDIYFTVSIPAGAGTLNVTYPRAFEAIGSRAAACVDLSTETTIMINCSAAQTLLNELYFQSVTFQPTDSQMSTVVSVYVDDLGNTDKLKRPMNASHDITINYSRDTGLIATSTEPDNTLTIALTVSAGAAIAGVATAIALTRKAKAAKVDDFFEKLGDTFDTSNTSPIYQGDKMKQFNSPFYQPKGENN